MMPIGSPNASRIVLDITTSVQYIGKPAVGIVRVEREITRALLRRVTSLDFVRYLPERQVFVQIAAEHVAEMVRDHAPSARALEAIDQELDYVWAEDSLLVSAGLVWDHDFLQAIYTLKRSSKLRLLQIAYDLIPILMPEFCVPGMINLFPKFVLNMLWTADAIFGISDSTNDTIRRYADQVGVACPELFRIKLGCDIGKRSDATAMPVAGLEPDNFVLYVSTIEPRKNHQLLYQVWRKFADDYPDSTTKLVFVGAQGWNMSDFMAIVQQDVRLTPHRIAVMSNLDDEQLGWLYDHCAFTVYPSLFEGWGLPVTESLARGKLCIASSTSSMPEASQGCVPLLDPLDFGRWYEEISSHILDRGKLRRAHEEIARCYRVESWDALMDEFVDQAMYLARR